MIFVREIKRMLLELLNKEDLDEKQELLSVGLDSLNVIKLIVSWKKRFQFVLRMRTCNLNIFIRLILYPISSHQNFNSKDVV